MGRGIARHNVQFTAWACILEGGIQACLALVNNAYLINRNIGVFQAHGEFFCLVATTDHVKDIFSNYFNIHIPEPGKIFSIYHCSAGDDEQMFLARVLSNQTQHKVERSRIFHEGEVDGRIARLYLFQASESRTDISYGCWHLLYIKSCCQASTDCGRSVVDVVQTRERNVQRNIT